LIDLAISGSVEPHTNTLPSHRAHLNTRNHPAMRAEKGGDWCETFFIAEDLALLSIGDICGHGIAKFDLMVAVRQVIRDAIRGGSSPTDTLSEANQFLCRFYPEETATAIVGLLDTKKKLFTFANAGHPAPLLASKETTRYIEFPTADLLLGVEASARTTLHTVNVPSSTLIVLYTDGVSEHDRDPLQGANELREAVAHAYTRSFLSTAIVIENYMNLNGFNQDDVSILTAYVE